jgi:hypothetical protein
VFGVEGTVSGFRRGIRMGFKIVSEVESGFGPGSSRSRVSACSQAGQCGAHAQPFDNSCLFDEEGEEFGEEDSGVEPGFSLGSRLPLSPPAPERYHVISMLNHFTIPVIR